MKYQVNQVLPYWIKTQIFRRKGLPEPQLYKFDEYSQDQPQVESFLTRDANGKGSDDVEKTEATV